MIDIPAWLMLVEPLDTCLQALSKKRADMHLLACELSLRNFHQDLGLFQERAESIQLIFVMSMKFLSP